MSSVVDITDITLKSNANDWISAFSNKFLLGTYGISQNRKVLQVISASCNTVIFKESFIEQIYPAIHRVNWQ